MSTPPANSNSNFPNPPVDLLRNKLAFGGDSMLWGIGIAFMPVGTVLTSLAAKLTDDKALIGALSLTWYVAYLLPQLFAARLVHGKPRTKPYSVWPSVIGRPVILLFALWLVFTRAQDPLLTMWVLLGTIALFLGLDALTSTAWFDMMGRAFTPAGRAQTLTINQFLGALGGIGSGFIVQWVLGSDRWPFPLNYAVLLIAAFVFFELSLISMLFIKERVSEEPITPKKQAESFGTKLRAALKSDASFRRLLLVRLLTSIENMASAFYIVFATERLGLGDESIGVFSIALLVGGLIGIAAFGWLAGRFGPRRVIVAACVAQFAAPLIALLVSVLAFSGWLPAPIAYGTFVLVMVLNGAVNRSSQVGFFSYAQDSAAEVDRPMYVGAVSTVAGLGSFMPVVGGLLIDGLTRAGLGAGAYSALFGVAVLIVGLGALLSLGLPIPKRV